MRALLHMDVRPALPLISAPTLVLHATRDLADPVQAARYMAARIPNAKMVELDSADHLIWLTDALDAMVNEIEDFAKGAVPSDQTTRVLSTVLCIDIAPGPSAEEAARQIAAASWRPGRQRRQRRSRHVDGPARAIRVASAIIGESPTAPAERDCTAANARSSGTIFVTFRRPIARQMAQLAPPVGSSFTDHP